MSVFFLEEIGVPCLEWSCGAIFRSTNAVHMDARSWEPSRRGGTLGHYMVSATCDRKDVKVGSKGRSVAPMSECVLEILRRVSARTEEGIGFE